MVRVCVLRCDVFELFCVALQDECSLNCSWISVPGMKSLNYFGRVLSRGLVSELLMDLHMRVVLRGRLDGPHSDGF